MVPTLTTHPKLADALGAALGIYDAATLDHSERVGSLARNLGEAVGLRDSQHAALGWAGLLHDIGKLSVPNAVLNKETELTRREWDLIKTHPAVGASLILAVSPKLAPIADAIRSHHERWDGSGYPDGLAGNAIPLLGRIIALADVYDAVTSPRPYRPARFTPTQAHTLIETSAETQFDPSLVPVFLDVLRRHPRRRRLPHNRPRDTRR